MNPAKLIHDAVENFLKNAQDAYGKLSNSNIGHEPTPQHRDNTSRHRGFTKNTGQGESKKRRKIAAKSRRINRHK